MSTSLKYPRGSAPAIPLDLSHLTLAEASALQVIASAAQATLINRYNAALDVAKTAAPDSRWQATHRGEAERAAQALLQARQLETAALAQERVAGRQLKAAA